MRDPSRIVVTYVRRVAGGSEKTTIRVKQARSPEQTYESLEEVPADLRPLIGEFLRPPDGLGSFRLGKLSPAREVDFVARLPKRIQVEEEGPVLRITYRWLSIPFFFLLALGGGACVYASGQAFWTTPGFRMFTGLGILIGVWLLYMALLLLCNRTWIEVNRKKLAIRHGPLYWPGSRKFRVCDVEQLYCRMHRSRRGRHYTLNAVTSGGEHARLVPILHERAQALYLERKIEEHLGIEDQPVADEM